MTRPGTTIPEGTWPPSCTTSCLVTNSDNNRPRGDMLDLDVGKQVVAPKLYTWGNGAPHVLVQALYHHRSILQDPTFHHVGERMPMISNVMAGNSPVHNASPCNSSSSLAETITPFCLIYYIGSADTHLYKPGLVHSLPCFCIISLHISMGCRQSPLWCGCPTNPVKVLLSG